MRGGVHVERRGAALGSKHNFYHRICKDMITIWMDKGANKFKKQKLTWITLNISLVPTCNLAQFAIVTSSIPLKEERLFKISVID